MKGYGVSSGKFLIMLSNTLLKLSFVLRWVCQQGCALSQRGDSVAERPDEILNIAECPDPPARISMRWPLMGLSGFIARFYPS